jgi:flagellin-like protein
MKEKMKKFRKSKKALSPVVASIILIAVTVAVSIAVAAWMGALTVGFMGSSSLTITNEKFVTGTTNSIALTIKNTGTKSVTIAQVKVNNAVVTTTPATLTLTSGEASAADAMSLAVAWVAGNPYKVDLYDTSGQIVGSYQGNAPGA